jgi:hypothetical protein
MLEPWMVDFLKKEEEKRRREAEQQPQLPAPEDMPSEFPEPEAPKEQRGVVVIES